MAFMAGSSSSPSSRKRSSGWPAVQSQYIHFVRSGNRARSRRGVSRRNSSLIRPCDLGFPSTFDLRTSDLHPNPPKPPLPPIPNPPPNSHRILQAPHEGKNRHLKRAYQEQIHPQGKRVKSNPMALQQVQSIPRAVTKLQGTIFRQCSRDFVPHFRRWNVNNLITLLPHPITQISVL